MKPWIFCCLALASAVAGKPAGTVSDPVEIVNSENLSLGDGEFYYTFELTDGTRLVAQSKKYKVTQDGKEVEVLGIKGSYSYIVDGVEYTVNYEAGPDGYKPVVTSEPSDQAPGISACVLASCLG